jgi:hypothetical protein
MTERPLFVDPITVGDGADVDDERAPAWFVLVALTLLSVAAYYLGSFWSGPRASSPHDFESGRTVYERVGATGDEAAAPAADH